MNLADAFQAITQMLGELNSDIAAKGYPDGGAKIDIEGGRATIWLCTDIRRMVGSIKAFHGYFGLESYASVSGEVMDDLRIRALAAIAGMDPDPTEAMRPWFELEPAAPVAQAAE